MQETLGQFAYRRRIERLEEWHNELRRTISKRMPYLRKCADELSHTKREWMHDYLDEIEERANAICN